MRWHCWPSAAECQVRTTANAISLYTRCTRGGPRIREIVCETNQVFSVCSMDREDVLQIFVATTTKTLSWRQSSVSVRIPDLISAAKISGRGHLFLRGDEVIDRFHAEPRAWQTPIASGLGLYGWGLHDTSLPSNMASVAPRSHCTAKKHKVPAILPASCPCRGCSWLLRRMRFPALAAASLSLPWRWHCWPSAAGCHSEDVLGVYHGHATVQMRSRCTRCTRGGPRIREYRNACMP